MLRTLIRRHARLIMALTIAKYLVIGLLALLGLKSNPHAALESLQQLIR